MANGRLVQTQRTNGEVQALQTYWQALLAAYRPLDALLDGHSGLYGSQGFAGANALAAYFEQLTGKAGIVIEAAERAIDSLCEQNPAARIYRARREELGALKFASREADLRENRNVAPHADYLRALWLEGKKPERPMREHYDPIFVVVEQEVSAKETVGGEAREVKKKVKSRPVFEYVEALRTLRGMRERMGKKFQHALDGYDHLDRPHVNEQLKRLKEEMQANIAKSEEAKQVATLTDRLKAERATAFREGTLTLMTIGIMTTPVEAIFQNSYIPEDPLLGDSAQYSTALKGSYDAFAHRLHFCGRTSIPVARDAIREAEFHLIHILDPTADILNQPNFDAAAAFLTSPVSVAASSEETEGEIDE